MKKNPSLIIAAGKGCFTCCRGCYQYFGRNQVSTIDLMNFVKKYKKAFNLKKITLAGGDPMTRKDIVYLIGKLNDMDLEVYMDTVGKNFIRNSDIVFQDYGQAKHIAPQILKDKITKIGIPLDGYNTKQINYFRTKITLEEIKRILSVLDKNGYNICINTVVNKANINDLKKIGSIIKKFENVTQWQLFQYSPIGDLGYKNKSLFEIDDSLFEEKIRDLLLSESDTHIKIEGKSNSYRKLNYILVNSDGKVWQPSYTISESVFIDEDSNANKTIIGTIYDEDIIEKIKIFMHHINENINIVDSVSTKIFKL